ncbi:hypothetical protein [Chitinophaga sancti]|uniref:Dolichyl-phosphate-mannose-protein mannosyltransferase n=1 Tax=Chitinophaga sancti TaxID=1004 RepID=A0A1K1T3W9_9BACT|nr:hypothetical protein [Chitinophaga sancti]WQD59575.1 hypothetical protein U0033_16910 [Chitinophaga sancti]WQG88291.1 hypothetical protein SR876_25555 [Chitinophaga sancti]SFW91264.1 hypothetical protein SAMN05661012_06756 [Chitinophaga sancti]
MTNLDNLVHRLRKEKGLSENVFQYYQNRKLIIISIIVIIIQIILYKLLYPYASFIFGDSYCYIDEAFRNVQIDTYPIGYPMFLRAFSAITISDTALVVFQYLLLQVSALSLIFTIFYFYNTQLITKYTLVLITVLNPLFLHLANTISSDNFFFSMSLIWFTLLIWLAIKPTSKIVIFHAIALFIAFTVRYNAMFYPFISLFSVFLTRYQWKLKTISLLLSLLLIGAFIKFNKDKYYELCGIRQFTPFAGWLMANNALYAYRYIPDSIHKRVPQRFMKLDNAVRTYFDSTRNNPRHPEEKIEAYHDYMWKDSSPLSIYWRNEYLNKNRGNEQKSWALAGALFNDYGKWIIKHYPITFIQHVIIPNSKKWFTPPIEFLEYYNSGLKEVPEYIQKWFHYDTNMLNTNIENPEILESIYRLYPMLAGIMNLLFLSSIIVLFYLQKINLNSIIIKIIIITIFLLISNYLFSVFASPIALRHQMFPIQITIIFSFIMIDIITDNRPNTKSDIK